MNEKKSYVGYTPKKVNVIKLTNYIQQGSNEAIKPIKQIKKGNKKRF